MPYHDKPAHPSGPSAHSAAKAEPYGNACGDARIMDARSRVAPFSQSGGIAANLSPTCARCNFASLQMCCSDSSHRSFTLPQAFGNEGPVLDHLLAVTACAWLPVRISRKFPVNLPKYTEISRNLLFPI